MSESETTARQYSEDELREAGASALFVAYYKEAPPDATARREVEKGPFSLEQLNESPSLGGSFFEALWSGSYSQAKARADMANSAILEKIKVA